MVEVKTAKKSSIQGYLSKIPLVPTDKDAVVSFGIVISAWISFVVVISINHVLLKRKEYFHFAEQFVIYNALSALTVLSLLAASTRSPGTPDPTLAPDGINHSRVAMEKDERPSTGYKPDAGADEDDIPLRYLRNSQWLHTRGSKDRPSPLSLTTHGGRRNSSNPRSTPSDGGFHMPSISPFPLNNSPFVPTSPTDAGEDTETSTPSSSTLERNTPSRVSGEEQDESGERDDEMLLPKRNVIMGKSSNGAPRWCKKCDQWKPDRCHHCRFCRRCTLKMDHHCVWIGTCVGFQNYKPFLLFISYGTLLAVYTILEAGYESIQFFRDPEVFYYMVDTQLCGSDGICKTVSTEVMDFAPVAFMLLALMGVFMGLTVGSLAGYHWWLASHNMTTLENLTHSYPSVLLESEPSGHAGTRPPDSSDRVDSKTKTRRHGGSRAPNWRPDHLLTRHERTRLRREARRINVYDKGWRANILEILGDGPWWTLGWPLTRVPKRTADGHHFEYDEAKLDRLRVLTAELRCPSVESMESNCDSDSGSDHSGGYSPRPNQRRGSRTSRRRMTKRDSRDEVKEEDGGDSDVEDGRISMDDAATDTHNRTADASQPNRETRGQKNGRNVQSFEA